MQTATEGDTLEFTYQPQEGRLTLAKRKVGQEKGVELGILRASGLTGKYRFAVTMHSAGDCVEIAAKSLKMTPECVYMYCSSPIHSPELNRRCSCSEAATKIQARWRVWLAVRLLSKLKLLAQEQEEQDAVPTIPLFEGHTPAILLPGTTIAEESGAAAEP